MSQSQNRPMIGSTWVYRRVTGPYWVNFTDGESYVVSGHPEPENNFELFPQVETISTKTGAVATACLYFFGYKPVPLIVGQTWDQYFFKTDEPDKQTLLKWLRI